MDLDLIDLNYYLNLQDLKIFLYVKLLNELQIIKILLMIIKNVKKKIDLIKYY